MLLDLADSHGRLRPLSVTALAIGSSIPGSTALRHLDQLNNAGLIVRNPDPIDKRRVFIDLSDAGVTAMTSYFAALGNST